METATLKCPHCQARCRIKNNSGNVSSSGLGKCPSCGRLFPVPPGLRKAPAKTATEKPENSTRQFQPGRIILACVIICGLLATALYTGFKTAQKSRRPATPRTDKKTFARPPLPPALADRAIAHIKQHALVGDAAISVAADGRLFLSLMVTANTPAAYAERLGQQFAYYLEKQYRQDLKLTTPPPLSVSVYYPAGTRIEVAISSHDGEEEVLPSTNSADP